MTTWRVGATYRMHGRDPITCVRRWWDGALEMVELAYAPSAIALGAVGVGGTYAHARIIRTACTPNVRPWITRTCGGVFRPDMCDHCLTSAGDGSVPEERRFVADGGPFAGRVVCSLCGAPPDEPLDSPTMRACVEAVERRAVA